MIRADFVPPTIADALACDREIFAKLSKLCSRDASGLQSLPTHIPAVLDHAEIIQLMVPKIGAATRKRPNEEGMPYNPPPAARPAGQAQQQTGTGPNNERNRAKRENAKKARDARAQELETYRASDPNARKGGKGDGKNGKGKKGKGKGKGRGGGNKAKQWQGNNQWWEKPQEQAQW